MTFWFDHKRNIEVTYDEFLSSLLKAGTNNIYIKEENPYEGFLCMLRNFLNKKKSIVLDSDFSEKEILDLGISEEEMNKGAYDQQSLIEKITSLDQVISFYEEYKQEINIQIYTSGTTGQPKKVRQSYKNLTRAVKKSDSMKNKVWGFAYNPTHFAGLQVFFQAFYNYNELVYLFDLEYNNIYTSLKERKVTHLSCTPTFMKIFLNFMEQPLESVENLTFGGEKFNKEIEEKVNEKFPNATIKNVYASTEAGSLLRSDGLYFSIPLKYKDVLKIVEGELLIHQDLLGDSSTFNLDNQWYKTGDLVEFVDENRFSFKNRKSDIINVGGYNVNPSEIEHVIKAINGVEDVSVFGRKNSITGRIIVAHVIKLENIDAQELKKHIKKVVSEKLQKYKQPRLIKFVDSFELTRTGKIKKA